MATIGNALDGVTNRGIANQVWKAIEVPDFPGGTLNTINALLESANAVDPDGYYRAAVIDAATGNVLFTSAIRYDITAKDVYAFTFAGQSVAAGGIRVALTVDGQTNPGGTFFVEPGEYGGLSSDNFYAVDPPASTVNFEDDSARPYCFSLDYTPAGATAGASNSLLMLGVG